MGLVRTTVATLTLAGAALYASHQTQLELIEEEASASMNTNNMGDFWKDIGKVHAAVRRRIHSYGGTYEFIAGDFDIRNGEARCGGIAALACVEGAALGLSSEIEVERHGLRIHYYTVLKRGKEKSRFELCLSKKKSEESKRSLKNSRMYIADARRK